TKGASEAGDGSAKDGPTAGAGSADAAPSRHAAAYPQTTTIVSSPAPAAAVQIAPARPPGATARTRTAATIVSAQRRFDVASDSTDATAIWYPANAVSAAVERAAIAEMMGIGEPEKRVATTSLRDVAPKRRTRGPKAVVPRTIPAATASRGGSTGEERRGSRQSAIPAATAAKPSPP